MGKCSKCNKDTETFPCDSCGAMLCRVCGDLTASEVKCLQLVAKRRLVFYCSECEAGLKQVPLLVAKVTEMQAQLADLIASREQVGAPLCPDSVDEAVFEEVSDRLSRRKNVVLFGVPDDNNKEADRRLLSQILDIVLPEVAVDGMNMFRLGRFKGENGGPRPIKLKLKNEQLVDDILSGSRLLKDSQEFKRVFISPDRTKKQTLFYKDVKKRFDERRARGEQNITIRYVNGMPKIVNKGKKN